MSKSRPNRSVVDFETEDALRKALMAVKIPDSTEANDPVDNNNVEMKEPPAPMVQESENLDWVLPCMDPETTEVQSMKEELHRLQVLKSYLILDAEREEAFERLTGLASRFFHVPIALISLVDLGRQWFMSNRGLGDVRETPRKHAFCAHAILNKHNILIVPDATLDFRFKGNPLVTGPPNIRFYAGAPLISPEGYKLGTFCIIDSKTRPAGLSQEEQASLRDFADMSVKELVERRTNLKRHQSPAQLIAYTAHDLMTPLTGVQLSLSLLKGDEEVRERLGGHQQELLSTAANCSDLMIRICQTAMDALRGESSAVVPDVLSTSKGSTPVTKMSELIKSLTMIMEPIPKTVPLVITLDPNVPTTAMSDDLKLFRSALNLISNGVGRTSLGLVHLRIFVEYGDSAKLFFECTDTGPEIQVEEYQYLFHPSRTAEGDLRLGLSSVATLINSLDGEYGFRPLSESDDGGILNSYKNGALFWFSVPLLTPENLGVTSDGEIPVSVIRKIASTVNVRRDGSVKQPIIPVMPKTASGGSFSTGMAPDALMRLGGRVGSNNNVAFSNSRNSSLSGLAGKRNSSLTAMASLAGSRGGSLSGLGMGGRNSSGNSVSSCGHRRIQIVVGDSMQVSAMNNSCFRNVFEPVGVLVDSKLPAVPTSVSVSRVPNDTPMQAPTMKPQRRKMRALIIEDSLVVRKSLARALEKLGLSVTQAVNGLEGLKSMKAKLFDFVLCDFLMPVMDGLDCVKQYRDWEKENRPDFRQYIVGISAHAGANDGDKGLKAGMNEFRPKPVSIKILTEIQKANQVSENSRQLDEIELNTGLVHSDASSAGSLSVLDQSQFPRSSSLHSGFGLARSPSTNGVNTKRGMPPAGSSLSAQQNFSFDMAQPAKRQKVDQGFVLTSDQGAPVCLLATDTPTKHSNEVIIRLEREGWKVVVVHDGQDALRLLKMRNWNSVLIDDDIPLLSGSECAKEFRLWEQQNRVSRQRNVFMVCKTGIPSVFDKSSIVQPPTGYDGVLGKPVEWKELDHMLGMKKERSFDIIVGGL